MVPDRYYKTTFFILFFYQYSLVNNSVYIGFSVCYALTHIDWKRVPNLKTIH